MQSDILGSRYRRLLGEKTGLVNSISTEYPDKGGPPVYVSKPELADIGKLSGTNDGVDAAMSGKGTTLEESLLTCLGEVVERYCFYVPPSPDEMVRGSYETISNEYETIEYDYLDAYNLETSDSMGRLSRRTTFDWATGTDLLEGTPTLVPDSLVWFYPDRDDRYLLSHSNGCATARTRERAIDRSLFEAIERDGLMRTWCLQSPPTRIRDVPAETRPLVSEFEERGYEITFYLLESTVGVPVIGCLFEDPSELLPDCVFSCSAGFSIADAMADTLVEAGQGWVLAKSSLLEYDMDDVHSNDEFDDPIETFLYYSCGEGTEILRQLLDVDETTSVDAIDTPETRTQLRDRLSAHSCRPIAFDVTTEDVRDAGLFVTRVLVPELIPLTPPTHLPNKHPELADETVTNRPHPYA